jgi:hypothetical protein
MKKTLILFTILLSVVFAVSAVDLTGNWKLNSTKSTLSDQFSMAPKEIIILQDGNNLNLERHSTFQDQDFTIKDKFTLDGVECVNPGWQDSEKKSTAVWSDDKASLKITTKFPMGDNGEMTIIEIYKMDGNNLIIESSASSSFGDRSETMVFDKQ